MKTGYLTIIIVLMLTSCGGGGSSTNNTSTSFISSYSDTIEKIDFNSKVLTPLTKNNVEELLNLFSTHIPSDSELTIDDYQILLSESRIETQECPNGGSITLETDNKNTQLSFTYHQCIVEDSTFNGTLNILFSNLEESKEVGFYRGKDLSLSNATASYVYNFNIKFDNSNLNYKSKEYYVDVYHVEKREQIQFNMSILEYEDNISIEAQVLLNNNTYFTLETKNINQLSIPLISIREDSLLNNSISSSSKLQFILHGKDSDFTYQHVNRQALYILTQDNQTSYKIKTDDEWTNDITTLFANEYTPSLYIKFNKYLNKYDNHYIVLENNQSFTLTIKDNDDFGEHTAKLILINKPKNSRLENNQTLLLSFYIPESSSNNLDLKNITTISLDAIGLYEFKIQVKDGERVIEKTFSLEYHQNISFDSNVTRLNGEFSQDIIFLEDINATALLNKSNNELLLIDKNNNHTVMSLPNGASDMSLIPNTNTLAISSDERVSILDYNTLAIIKQYNLPSPLGNLVYHNNYIYVLEENTQGRKLFSLNLETGQYSTIDYASYGIETIVLNPMLNSLYINDFSYITKYNLAEGNATKLYKSSSRKEYDFNMNLWATSNNALLTTNGTTFSMSNTQATDMLDQGLSEIINIKKNKYRHDVEKLSSYATNLNNDQYLFSTTDVNKDPYFTSKKNIINKIKIHRTTDNNLTYSRNLLQYHQTTEEKNFRCFVKNSIFIAENKVLVLYEAREYSRRVRRNSDPKFNFYEIIELP